MKKLVPLIITLVIGIIAAYGMWQLTATVSTPTTPTETSSGEAQIGGAFTLTDQNGKQVSDTDFKGKLMLVYFGFTYCPDICPTDISIMAQAMTQLGEQAAEVAPIFISIDPERDTQAQLSSYLSSFKPQITGLTGDTAPAIKAYKVYAKKVPSDDGKDYTMDHSAFMYLMDRNGKYLTHFRHNSPPAEIATKIREYL